MKYRYYMTQRPPGPGCQPAKGMINADFNTGRMEGHRIWGYVEYDRQLTSEEINDYELMEVKK